MPGSLRQQGVTLLRRTAGSRWIRPLKPALRAAWQSSVKLARRARALLKGPTYAAIASHELFDRAWYLDRNSDARNSRADPVEHYLKQGAARGCDPHPLFDTDWYRARHPDVAARGINALIHYAKFGSRARLDPNPLFDGGWYLQRYPDVALGGFEPFTHFVRSGVAERRDPSPLFDTKWYLQRYPDVSASGVAPVIHFLSDGVMEGRQTNDPQKLLAGLRIAVVVHLFHTDLWPEIVAFLQNIPIAFDLWVTTPNECAAEARPVVERAFPRATLVPVANVGRDTVPFLAVVPRLVAGGYDLVCKLHTKKGATEPTTWRRLLLEGTLADRILVTRILDAFKRDTELQLVGHGDLYMSGPQYMTQNRTLLEDAVHRVSPQSSLPDEWGFFAGTMFWVRPALLADLAASLQGHEALETDSAATDGQLAHVIERMFGLLVTLKGGKIGLTGRLGPGPLDATLDIVRAPGRPHRRALADFLSARAERDAATSCLPARPKPLRTWRVPTPAEPGVNFIGPVEYFSGLGTSARGYVHTLLESGIETNVVPWRLGFDRLKRQERTFPSSPDKAINLVHVNLDLLTTARLLDRAPLRDLVTSQRFNVAIVYWELAALLPEWSDVIARFDEVWCASSFVARALGAVSPRPTRVVRPCLLRRQGDVRLSRADFGIPSDRLVFFYAADAGSVLGRKNPRALLDAYVKEFTEAEGAFCLVKLHTSDPDNPSVKEFLDLAAGRSDVAILDRSLSEQEILCLFGLIDCYVSPHRSEGLGLTILEAMQAGKPVIATPYGGVTDFVTETTASLLDYRMVEVGEGCDPYPAEFVWADPLPHSLRKAMRAIFADRAAAAALGERGRKHTLETYSPQTTGRVIRSEVERIWRDAGGSLH